MILNDIVKSLTGGSDERVNASWRASLTTAWLIVNWKFIAYVTMSDEPVSERITSAINTYYSNWSWIYLPLIVWLSYIIATPIISLANIAYHQLFKGTELWLKQTSSQKEIDRLDTETRRLEEVTTKLEIDRNDLQKKYDQIVEQTNEIDDEIKKRQTDKENLHSAIDELKDNKKDFEMQIESQKATIDELANEFKEKKFQLEEDISEIEKQIQSKRKELEVIEKPSTMTRNEIVNYKGVLAGMDLSNTDLQRLDLSGADLRGADLSRSDLSGSKLSGANLSGADLGFVILDDTDLRHTVFSKIKDWQRINSIERANITGAKFSSRPFKDWALLNGVYEEPPDDETKSSLA